jgi:hypothetical protein
LLLTFKKVKLIKTSRLKDYKEGLEGGMRTNCPINQFFPPKHV